MRGLNKRRVFNLPELFVDDLRALADPDRWYDHDVLAGLAQTRDDFVQWARALAIARRQGVDVKMLSTVVDRLRAEASPVPERVELAALIKAKRKRPTYVVDGLFPTSGLSVLAGGPKAGKSTFARYVMCRVARGEKALGRTTKRGGVLYYILEEKLDEVVECFRKLGATGLPIALRCGRFPSNTFIDTFKRDVEETGAVYAVADPMFDILDVDDSNAYTEVNAALKAVVDCVRSLPVHLTFIHHSNKSGLRTTASILGSRAIEGATDTNVMLEMRDDGKRLIWSEQRYGVKIHSSFLELNEATGEVRLKERRVI